jgi:hypothetical protein
MHGDPPIICTSNSSGDTVFHSPEVGNLLVILRLPNLCNGRDSFRVAFRAKKTSIWFRCVPSKMHNTAQRRMQTLL